MIKTIINNGYSVILNSLAKDYDYIISETYEDLKETKDIINWYNFNIGDRYYNNNCDMLDIEHVDNENKIIVLQV